MKKLFRKRTSIKNHLTPFTVLMLIVLLVYALILLLLLAWAGITAFKSQDDFFSNTWKLPKEWFWNFNAILDFSVKVNTSTGTQSVFVPQMIVNSLLYSTGCALVKTFITCVTAYVCAKYQYRFSKIVYTTVLITMIIPIVGSLPSEIAMARSLGLYNKIWGLWIMQANFLGMYFMVFFATFAVQPKAYVEAAKIDGANNWQIMFRISLPLIRSVFGTILLINFITYWNDYQTPLIYLPNYPTLANGTLSLSLTIDNFYSTTPMRIAGAVLLMMPALILFLVFQKRLMGNLDIGGIKG